MRSNSFSFPLSVALLAVLTIAPSMHAQGGFMNQIKQQVKDKVQQRVDQTADSATDAAYDKGTHAVKCVLSDNACIKKAQAAGQPVAVVTSQGQPVSAADSAKAIAAAGAAPGTPPASAATPASPQDGAASVDVHNDFTPGTQVLYQTDFADATVGDFPRNVTLQNGNMEIASWNGKKFLRATSSANFSILLPEVLPQRFTIEYDYTGSAGWDMSVSFADPNAPDSLSGDVTCSTGGSAEINPNVGAKSGSSLSQDVSRQLIHCAFMADSDYMKAYINNQRLAQSPNAPFGRSRRVYFTLTGSEDDPAFIGNIRVAAGGRDMYEALTTDGRFTTHGILFATGSANIDPASSATLTQIGQMLQQHADLKLEIDGHTDNVGSAASNQILSDQRAASVRQYLVSNFRIDGSRLSSKGYGASKPVASNTTADGRQQNRRVELVKM